MNIKKVQTTEVPADPYRIVVEKEIFLGDYVCAGFLFLNATSPTRQLWRKVTKPRIRTIVFRF
jgi:hypothetical protein